MKERIINLLKQEGHELIIITARGGIVKEMKLDDTIEQIKELGLGTQLIKLQNAYGPKAIQSILGVAIVQETTASIFVAISNMNVIRLLKQELRSWFCIMQGV